MGENTSGWEGCCFLPGLYGQLCSHSCLTSVQGSAVPFRAPGWDSAAPCGPRGRRILPTGSPCTRHTARLRHTPCVLLALCCTSNKNQEDSVGRRHGYKYWLLIVKRSFF